MAQFKVLIEDIFGEAHNYFETVTAGQLGGLSKEPTAELGGGVTQSDQRRSDGPGTSTGTE
eukprot:1779008-Rhodomonas_salina.1